MNGRICSVAGCEKEHDSHGYCGMHAHRWRAHGDPLTTLRAPNGSGTLTEYGYRVHVIDGQRVREHRKVVEKALGRKLRPDEHVHHINGIKTDNRPENLVVMSQRVHNRIHREPRTACAHGHPWDEQNTRWYGNERRCRACDRITHAQKYRAKKSAGVA